MKTFICAFCGIEQANDQICQSFRGDETKHACLSCKKNMSNKQWNKGVSELRHFMCTTTVIAHVFAPADDDEVCGFVDGDGICGRWEDEHQ